MRVLMLQRVSSRVSGFPVASSCLSGKLQNLSLLKVSDQVVTWFCVAGVGLCDIPTCFRTCRKSFCVAGAIHLRRFQMMGCSFRGRRGTLDVFIVILRGRRGTSDMSRCVLYTPHSTLYTPHLTLHTPHFTFHTSVHSTLTLYTLRSTLYAPHSTLHTQHFTLQTLHFTLHTQHFTLYTPQIANSTLYTPHFTHHTLHFTLYTLHSPFHTPHSTLHTQHFTLRTLH